MLTGTKHKKPRRGGAEWWLVYQALMQNMKTIRLTEKLSSAVVEIVGADAE